MADMNAAIGAFNTLRMPLAGTGASVGAPPARSEPGRQGGRHDSVPAILLSINATNAQIAHATSLHQTQVTSGLAADASRDVLDSVLAIRKLAERAVWSAPLPEDRAALQGAYEQSRGRIDSVVAEAGFDGVNLLAGEGGAQRITNASGLSFDVSSRLLDTAALGLDGLDLTTPDGATAALAASDRALSTVTEAIHGFGEGQSTARLQRESMREMALVLQPALGDRIAPPADPDAAFAMAAEAGLGLADSLLPMFTRSQDVLGMFD